MNADWEEIKKLAADLQRAQLTTNQQRLSEQNCIEIVTLLINQKLIDVVYTNDGKEYITRDHIEKEILDELIISGGRVNLVELARNLNIDLTVINIAVEKLTSQNNDLKLLLGQLINNDYISRVAIEINEKLLHSGEVLLSDLTNAFDLPSSFIQHNIIEKNLGKIIKGKFDSSDSGVLFTHLFTQRCKSKIRGALQAITKPTTISIITQQLKINEQLFRTLFDEIFPPGVFSSRLTNSEYIPSSYLKLQTNWIESFYNQNGYLEYDTVKKLGISEPKNLIKKHFMKEKLIFLKNFVVGPKLTDFTLMSAIIECISSKSYVDIATIVPSAMSLSDMEELVFAVMSPKNQSNFILIESIVFSKTFLTDLVSVCFDLAHLKGKEAVDNGKYQQFLLEQQIKSKAPEENEKIDIKSERREERRRKAVTGKTGGGTQGRETKTKSNKKNFRETKRGGLDCDDKKEPEKQDFEFLSMNDIEESITKKLEEEGIEHLSHNIANIYYTSLNQTALTEAKRFLELSGHTQKKETYYSVQEKLNSILVDMKLYEKGFKTFPNDTQIQLEKYLLKTIGNNFCNEIAAYVSIQDNMESKGEILNYEQRQKLFQICSIEPKTTLFNLNKAQSKGSLEDFYAAADEVLELCSITLKKQDKRKEKFLINFHKDKLCEQILSTDDPAIVLHLAVLILFISKTGHILHASGKFVSHILTFLFTHLTTDEIEQLKKFHCDVLKLLSNKDEELPKQSLLEDLKLAQNDIKDLCLKYAKKE